MIPDHELTPLEELSAWTKRIVGFVVGYAAMMVLFAIACVVIAGVLGLLFKGLMSLPVGK